MVMSVAAGIIIAELPDTMSTKQGLIHRDLI